MHASEPRFHLRLFRLLGAAVGIAAALLAIIWFLQVPVAHRLPQYFPEGDPMDLRLLLAQDQLTEEDYHLVYDQTGLAPVAVDDLRRQGLSGRQQILDTQKGFFAHHEGHCFSLIPGRITCEDRIVDENGEKTASVPIAPLQAGDVLLTFSTHSFGWRHGHAGLVIDPEAGTVLEAAQLGSDTFVGTVAPWQTYSSLILLRVRDVSPETRQEVVDFALEHLDGVPYSLFSGLLGAEKTPQSEPIRVQCAYLPWLAWLTAGVDLDGDGGRLVTVQDLIESPLLEVVQVYGVDPEVMAVKSAEQAEDPSSSDVVTEIHRPR